MLQHKHIVFPSLQKVGDLLSTKFKYNIGMNKSKRMQSITQGFREMSTEAVMLHQAIADRLGLHVTDHKTMDFLYHHGSLTAGELAKLTGLTTGAITGVIDRLEKAGYVRRANDANDRRVKVIELTNNKKLAEKLRSMFVLLEENTHRHLEQYSEDELEFIERFLSHSVEISREHRKRLAE